jgi:hypothetical protein
VNGGSQDEDILQALDQRPEKGDRVTLHQVRSKLGDTTMSSILL